MNLKLINSKYPCIVATRIFALVLCLLILDACTSPKPIVEENKSIIDNFSFKPGTYWIYKDSISGRVDSFWVVENVEDPDNSGGIIYNTKRILINCTNLNLNLPKVYLAMYFYLDTNMYFQYSITDTYISKVNVGGATAPLFFGLVSPKMINDPSLVHNTVDTVFNTYNLLSKTYYNVGVIGYFIKYPTNYNQIYLCPKVGIAKLRTNNATDTVQLRVWELERYNVVL